MLKGIDISNHQGKTGFTPHNYDIDFCIAKATESNGFVDPYCDGFIQDCIANDILWGFYHFNGTADPVSEANFFVENTRNYFGHGIPCLDYEVENENDRSWVEQFIQRVYDLTGVWCMVYMSVSWLPRFQGSWVCQKCGLWLAGYPYPATNWRYDDPPYGSYPWDFIAIWQFTSSLQIGWVKGIDADIAYMDADAWMKYAKSSSTVKPETPVQPVKDYKTVIKQVLDGQWGNGTERSKRLNAAGYDAQFVQDTINEYYEIAEQVISGKWGNGWNRQQALNGAGYDYETIQSIVNAILSAK